jgi:aldose 1-epimerase
MNADNRILTLAEGATSIDVWTIGARLNAVSWNGHDGLIDGSASVAEATGSKLNNGCVVGPVANRIAGAAFDLDGRIYRFAANEGADTLLHSGDRSLRDAVWDVVSCDRSSARLAADVADMADGFPGNRRFEARYRVVDDGFDLEMTAVSDAPTLVNLALHPYWRLDAGGRDGLSLKVKADAYLPVDAKKIPTGEIAPVTGTMFDLRAASVPNTGIDHNFCLSPLSEDVPSAELASERIALKIWTDAPGLQVFTGKDFGIALEPQHWPDAMHHAGFPSVRLEPGATYRQVTRYRFGAR